EPRLHLMPALAGGCANEEVDAAQVGRAEHHGGHPWPDRPGEELARVVREEVEDAEAENQEGCDEERERASGSQHAVVARRGQKPRLRSGSLSWTDRLLCQLSAPGRGQLGAQPAGTP